MELQKVNLQIIDRYDESCSTILNDWHSQMCAGVPHGGKGNQKFRLISSPLSSYVEFIFFRHVSR